MIRIKEIFNKEILLNHLSKLEIKEVSGVIITKYDGKLLKETDVSTRYESFDFSGYVSKIIDEILKNFNINKYELIFKDGKQQIILTSDDVVLDDDNFKMSFYILNSSDKSRALNISLGLRSDNYSFITEAGTIYKKHYTGISDYVDEKLDIKTEVFKQQLEVIKSLKNDEISFKNLKKVITTSLTKDDKYLSSQESVFINFLSKYYSSEPSNSEIKKSLFSYLYSSASKRTDLDIDFSSYQVFKVYLKLFSNKDSYTIKNESERIMRMSKYFKRRNILNLIES